MLGWSISDNYYVCLVYQLGLCNNLKHCLLGFLSDKLIVIGEGVILQPILEQQLVHSEVGGGGGGKRFVVGPSCFMQEMTLIGMLSYMYILWNSDYVSILSLYSSGLTAKGSIDESSKDMQYGS